MAAGKKGSDKPVVIKKYANRRLYDTGRSSYVTLEDLCQMMKEGYEFVVYDAKTGEDLTRSVLTQIVVEQEANGEQSLLPTSFLRQLISFYGDNMGNFVPTYLEQSFGVFMKNQEQLREQLTKSFGNLGNMSQGFNPQNFGQMPGMQNMPNVNPMQVFEEWTKQNMSIMENAMKAFGSFAATAAKKDDAKK